MVPYRTRDRDDDRQEWLQHMFSRFEPYMKKMYYMAHGNELTKPHGGHIQFLMAMAVYLYTTMLNITAMESGEAATGYRLPDTHPLSMAAESHKYDSSSKRK